MTDLTLALAQATPGLAEQACRSAALCGADIVVLSAEASGGLLRTCARLAPELRIAIAITGDDVVLFDADGQQVRSTTTPRGATIGVAGTDRKSTRLNSSHA